MRNGEVEVGSTVEIQNKHYKRIKNDSSVVETEEGTYLNRLVIPNVRMEDAGVYVCLGLNQGGGSDIREALLTVTHSPGNTTGRLDCERISKPTKTSP